MGRKPGLAIISSLISRKIEFDLLIMLFSNAVISPVSPSGFATDIVGDGK